MDRLHLFGDWTDEAPPPPWRAHLAAGGRPRSPLVLASLSAPAPAAVSFFSSYSFIPPLIATHDRSWVIWHLLAKLAKCTIFSATIDNAWKPSPTDRRQGASTWKHTESDSLMIHTRLNEVLVERVDRRKFPELHPKKGSSKPERLRLVKEGV